MISLLQFVLAVFAIFCALKLGENLNLLIPLGCLVAMFVLGRLDKRVAEEKAARKDFLKSQLDKIRDKEAPGAKEQEFFTIESLLWPKSEMLLIDAVHFIFKDLGFKITARINNSPVDRLICIPNTQEWFGVEILMSENEADRSHMKIARALQFQKEKKEKEKALIIGSTHTHLALSERDRIPHLSEELDLFLARHRISFMSAYDLYQLWQEAKFGGIDVSGVFHEIFSDPGGIFPLSRIESFAAPPPPSSGHQAFPQ